MYLVIGPIIEDPKIELLYAFLFIVGGLLFYFPLVVFKLDRGCFGRFQVNRIIPTSTVLPAKSESADMFCLQSY